MGVGTLGRAAVCGVARVGGREVLTEGAARARPEKDARVIGGGGRKALNLNVVPSVAVTLAMTRANPGQMGLHPGLPLRAKHSAAQMLTGQSDRSKVRSEVKGHIQMSTKTFHFEAFQDSIGIYQDLIIHMCILSS